jgi:hypothetical protein
VRLISRTTEINKAIEAFTRHFCEKQTPDNKGNETFLCLNEKSSVGLVTAASAKKLILNFDNQGNLYHNVTLTTIQDTIFERDYYYKLEHLIVVLGIIKEDLHKQSYCMAIPTNKAEPLFIMLQNYAFVIAPTLKTKNNDKPLDKSYIV